MMPALSSFPRRPAFAALAAIAAFLTTSAHAAKVKGQGAAQQVAVGTGTVFSGTDEAGAVIELASDAPIRLSMVVADGTILYTVQERLDATVGSATFVLSGLKKNVIYTIRQDGAVISRLKASPKGLLTFPQDLSTPHSVVVTNRPGSIFIQSDGTVSPSTAPISASGNVYTLLADIGESIIIQRDGIILDGGGHLLAGSGQATGIEVSNRRNVTIRNVRVQGFQTGLFITAVNSRVSASTFSANLGNGIISQLSGASNTCNPTLPEIPPEGIGEQFSSQSCNIIESSVVKDNGFTQLILTGNYFDQLKNNIVGTSSGIGTGILLSSVRRTLTVDSVIQRNNNGFLLQVANQNAFIGNTVANNLRGWFLESDNSSNVISSNTINANLRNIVVLGGSGHTIKNNLFSQSSTDIELNSVGLMHITNNRFETNLGGRGVSMFASRNVTVKSNAFQSGDIGVFSSSTRDSLITSNVFGLQGSASVGISDVGVLSNVTVSSNIFDGAQVGVQLRLSNGNRIFRNSFRNAPDFGIHLENGSGNSIFQNNFLGNRVHANLLNAGANTWSLPYPQGGNHWDDFTAPDQFSGPSQNLRLSDGIVDVPRVLAAGNQDRFPFVNPDGWLHIDTAPPSAVTDLVVTASQETSLALEWTAPGDDGAMGTAREYDLRLSQIPFFPFQFESLPRLSGVPDPLPAGMSQSFSARNLQPSTTYYFAIRGIDEFGNKGPVSPLAQGMTRADSTPPQPVTDLAARFGSVRQISPTVVIEPFDGDVLLAWTTPFDSSTVTGFQVFRSTDSGVLGVQISTIAVAGLSAPVKAALGGKNFFVDPGLGLQHGVTYFYTVRPVDLIGNIQAAGNNTASLLEDRMPPTLEAGLAPSAASFLFDADQNRLITKRLPAAQEASFNLIRFQDEGLSGGFSKVALRIDGSEFFIASGAFTASSSSPAFIANSATPGLPSPDLGLTRTGCLTYIVVDRAGNRASSSLAPTNCLTWDGAPAFPTLIALDPEPLAQGPVTLEIDTLEPLSEPPSVSIRQSGSTEAATVVFSSATTLDPRIFQGSYDVRPGLDGFAQARIRTVDLLGNASVDESQGILVEADFAQPLFDVRASPGYPETFNPNRGTANIIASVRTAPVDVSLDILNPAQTVVVRSATFANVSNTDIFFSWDGRDGLGSALPDGTYLFQFSAFLPGTSTQVGSRQSGFIRLVRSLALGGADSFPTSLPNSFPGGSLVVEPVISTAAEAAALAAGQNPVSAIYDLQPSGTLFDPPTTIVLCLQPPALLADFPGIAVARFKTATQLWESLAGMPSAPDPSRCLSAAVDGFSSFALLAPLGGVPLRASLDLDPDTLNLKSQGQFISAFIEVTGPKSATDIAPLTLRITHVNDAALAAPISINQETAGKAGNLKHVAVGDMDQDGILDLAVKFDRQDVIAVLPADEQVKLTVEGAFKDGTPIRVDDLIRTVRPGTVDPASAGRLLHHSRARLDVPAAALAQPVDVSILQLSAQPSTERSQREESARKRSLKTVGVPFEFGPEGTRFSIPVTISLPYETALLPREVSPADLRVAYWNPATSTWEPLPSKVDQVNRQISAETDHFSLYQVIAQAQPAVSGPPSELRLDEVYCFPNPARRGRSPTFHVEAGSAERIELRIYDVSGELVHETELGGAPQVVDDGQGPQWAYEYTWSGRIASGVYVYVVTAQKGGQKERRTGRCAVVR